MPIKDIWSGDLKMLEIVVELQIYNNGTFLLDQIMDKVGLLDRGDSYTGLTPWVVTESLRRLSEADFILFSGPLLEDDFLNDFDEVHELQREWFETENHQPEDEFQQEMKSFRLGRVRQQQRRDRIEEAFFRGTSFEDIYWSSGRFYIDEIARPCQLRAKPGGLRRVGA